MPKALDTIVLGFHGEIHAGEEVPATFLDVTGEHATDFERLAELGLIDKAPKSRERAAKPEPEPAGDELIGPGLTVADFEASNAKDIAGLVAEAPLELAQAVLGYELAHENRKTVTGAAEARIAELTAE